MLDLAKRNADAMCLLMEASPQSSKILRSLLREKQNENHLLKSLTGLFRSSVPKHFGLIINPQYIYFFPSDGRSPEPTTSSDASISLKTPNNYQSKTPTPKPTTTPSLSLSLFGLGLLVQRRGHRTVWG